MNFIANLSTSQLSGFSSKKGQKWPKNRVFDPKNAKKDDVSPPSRVLTPIFPRKKRQKKGQKSMFFF
jgi:hypothetical protein